MNEFSGLIIKGEKNSTTGAQTTIANFSNPFVMIDRTMPARDQAIELTINSIKLPTYSLGYCEGVARFVNQYGFTIDEQVVGVYHTGSLPSVIAGFMASSYDSAGALQTAVLNSIANTTGMAFQQWISWVDPITPINTNGSFTPSASGNGEMFAPILVKSISIGSQKPLFWDYALVTINSLATTTASVPPNNLVINDDLMIAPNLGNWFDNPPAAATLQLRQSKHADGQYYVDVYVEAHPTLNIAYHGDFGWWPVGDTNDNVNDYIPRAITQPNMQGTVIDLYIRAFSNDTKNSYKIGGKTD